MKKVPNLRSENEVIKNILGRSKLIISDIDYTLFDFGVGHLAGIQSLKSLLGNDISVEIDRSFHLILDGHRFKEKVDWNGRDDFDLLMANMTGLQSSSEDQYGIKVWSREAWIILAARKLGRTLTATEVEQARDKYWTEVTNHIDLYPDATDLLKIIDEKKIPLILFTGSDSVMQVYETPAGLQLKYEPDFSKQRKRKRLKNLPINYADIVIGDPIDKPDPIYFDQIEKIIARFGTFDRSHITFIGDSPRNDLQVPEERGYQAIFIQRK